MSESWINRLIFDVMSDVKHGFGPVYDKNSRILILGSFPSVKSREVEFYYGNRQNRFWKTVCGFFGELVPESTEDKRNFLSRRKIALWDMVTECEIEGSSDSSIKNFKVARLEEVLGNAPIELIILNGGKATEIFRKHYPEIAIPVISLPSTSPANTRDATAVWHSALSCIFDDD